VIFITCKQPGSIAIQMLDNEIEVLSRVNHSHIIKLIEVYETPKKVFMVLEMCEGGELSDLLKEKRVFKEEV
jgi:serine/threonine kinase 33